MGRRRSAWQAVIRVGVRIAFALSLLTEVSTSFAQTLGAAFKTERVAIGLFRPVFLAAPPGDCERGFVVEQHTGRIRIIRLADRTIDETPFLDIDGISTGSEQGLLGLAFHPDYATNGFFYVYLTDPNTQVRRYSVSADPDLADPSSALPILSIVQPQTHHNGGWLGFGRDGYLYLASGDGGGETTPGAGIPLASETLRTCRTTCSARSCGSMSMGMGSRRIRFATTPFPPKTRSLEPVVTMRSGPTA